MEERRASSATIVAVSTIVSLLVGTVSLLTYIQSSERRNTTMEVKIEVLLKGMERQETEWKEFKKELEPIKEGKRR